MNIDTYNNVEKGVGMASAIAFAVPVAGPMLAALISAGDFVFNMVDSPEDSLQTTDLPLTKKDLQQFVDKLESDEDKKDLEKALGDIDSMQIKLLNHWTEIMEDMKKWDATELKQLGTLDGWERMIREDADNFTSSENPINQVIDTCGRQSNKRYVIPLFIHAINAYILQAKVCLIGEYAILQINHDLKQAEATLAAKKAEEDNKTADADTDESLAASVLKAVQSGEIDMTKKDEKVPEHVVKKAVDVIKPMPPRDVVANASEYVAELKKTIIPCRDILRKHLEVTDVTRKKFADKWAIVSSNIIITNEEYKKRRKNKKGVRIQMRDSQACYFLGDDKFMQDWIFGWVEGMYFDLVRESTFDDAGIVEMSAYEHEAYLKAEKFYDDLVNNTTNILVGFQKADLDTYKVDVKGALDKGF